MLNFFRNKIFAVTTAVMIVCSVPLYSASAIEIGIVSALSGVTNNSAVLVPQQDLVDKKPNDAFLTVYRDKVDFTGLPIQKDQIGIIGLEIDGTVTLVERRELDGLGNVEGQLLRFKIEGTGTDLDLNRPIEYKHVSYVASGTDRRADQPGLIRVRSVVRISYPEVVGLDSKEDIVTRVDTYANFGGVAFPSALTDYNTAPATAVPVP